MREKVREKETEGGTMKMREKVWRGQKNRRQKKMGKKREKESEEEN